MLIAALLGGEIVCHVSPVLASHCLVQSQSLVRQKDLALSEYASAASASDKTRICAALRNLLSLHEQMYGLPDSCSHSDNAAQLKAALLRDISVLRDSIRSDCR